MGIPKRKPRVTLASSVELKAFDNALAPMTPKKKTIVAISIAVRSLILNNP